MADYRNISVERATREDYDEVTDKANLIFTNEPDEDGSIVYDHGFFQGLLPKLYRDADCSMPAHYLVRENGEIVSLAGSFENTVTVGDKSLRVRGIGTVGVHPAHRGKGYMKAIMYKMMEDCKEDGIDFSYLGGLRQRYEHFGFSTAAQSLSFVISGGNMNYIYGQEANFGYTFTSLSPQDEEALDAIFALYQTLPVRVHRERAKLYDILINWCRVPLVIRRDGAFAGWCITDKDYTQIHEIHLVREDTIGEVLCDYIRRYDIIDLNLYEIGQYELEKVKYLALRAESMMIQPHEEYRIYRFDHMIDAYLSFKAGYQKLCDGEITVEIQGVQTICISVSDNQVTVRKTDKAPDLVMDEILATQFFFGTGKLLTDFGLDVPAFAEQWLPLPLCFSDADGV